MTNNPKKEPELTLEQQQHLENITRAVAAAKRSKVPLERIAKAVRDGMGLIEGRDPFEKDKSTGWGER